MAKGLITGSCTSLLIACRFNPELHAMIDGLATKNKRSFAYVVRELCTEALSARLANQLVKGQAVDPSSIT